jgi:hypothetical protein
MMEEAREYKLKCLLTFALEGFPDAYQDLLHGVAQNLRQGKEIPKEVAMFIANRLDIVAQNEKAAKAFVFPNKKKGRPKENIEAVIVYFRIDDMMIEQPELNLTSNQEKEGACSLYAQKISKSEGHIKDVYAKGKKLFLKNRAEWTRKSMTLHLPTIENAQEDNLDS